MRATVESAPNDPHADEYFKQEKVRRKLAETSGPGAASPPFSLVFFPFHPPVPVSPFPARWPGAWLFSAAAPNVAPRAPYQRCYTNSWEQLSGGFNSSRATEVKGRNS